MWGASTPDGFDFVIEDTSQPGGQTRFRASQVLRNCCSSYERPLGTLGSLDEAQRFLEKIATEQTTSTVSDD